MKANIFLLDKVIRLIKTQENKQIVVLNIVQYVLLMISVNDASFCYVPIIQKLTRMINGILTFYFNLNEYNTRS